MKKKSDTDASSLVERHRRELAHHDLSHAAGDGCSFVYSTHPTYPIFQDLLKSLAAQTGEEILEYGCGTGWSTSELASLPIRLQAFDISTEAVTQARDRLCAAPRNAQYEVKQMVAEKLEFPDGHFDAAVGFAILHHLDLKLALPEMARILRPNGRALFAEPLGSNAAINFYRRRTPEYRTADERPLNLQEFIAQASPWFTIDYRAYYLTALVPLVLGAVLPARLVGSLLRPTVALDRALFRLFPWTQKYAWYVLLTMRARTT